MSMLSLVKHPEVIPFLRPIIRNPRFRTESRVPSTTGLPQRIGTAFDYAMRAGLRARFGGVGRSLVAEHAPKIARKLAGKSSEKRVHERLQRALAAYSAIPASGPLAREGAEACLDLAALEWVYRSRMMDGALRKATKDELAELQDLYALVPWDEFRPERVLYLNPLFGKGSYHVGGADADLVLDDMIIDIKTIKTQALEIETVRQLVGYALLGKRFGVNDDDPTHITRIGVYFARAGQLRTWTLSEVIDPSREKEVLDFLLARAIRNQITDALLTEEFGPDEEAEELKALEKESGIAISSWEELSRACGIPTTAFGYMLDPEPYFDAFEIPIVRTQKKKARR